eukprot:m.1025860 g.1025860  ORF g.1025860 m.1025860 type:complete len:103 (-) comp24106_c1_seq8:1331-1639(-)
MLRRNMLLNATVANSRASSRAQTRKQDRIETPWGVVEPKNRHAGGSATVQEQSADGPAVAPLNQPQDQNMDLSVFASQHQLTSIPELVFNNPSDPLAQETIV